MDFTVKPIAAAMALAILWAMEGVIPMFEGRRNRVRHDAANIVLGVFNALLAGGLGAGVSLYVTEWSRAETFGLLHRLQLPTLIAIPTAIIIFDAWQYVWHRLNHRVPLLWRFHAVHHADAHVDASTALRFHTGEILASMSIRLAVLPLLGITIQQLMIYETLLLPIILFHHSNIRIPRTLDRVLRSVTVTPRMHWVHHSQHQPETDSNFSSVFSWWDRVFGTFRLRSDPGQIELGLKDVAERDWNTLKGMLQMPLRSQMLRRTDEG